MDEIVQEIGLKNNCKSIDNTITYSLILGTFCGVFRRQALDRGAMLLGVDKIVTGHNADDIAETIMMNGNHSYTFYCRYKKTFPMF